MLNIDPRVIWGAKLLKDGTKEELLLQNIMITTSVLDIKASIWNMFPVVAWAFNYNPAILENGDIYIGRPIELFFNDPERSKLVSFKFCIYSIINLTGSGSANLGERFHLSLIPRWVFNQISISISYRNRASLIIDNLLSEELSEFLSKGIVVDSVDPERLRFRTHQTPLTFIKKRVAPYLRGKDNTSIFFYTTLEETYEVIDVASMKTENMYTIIDKNSSEFPRFQSDLSSAENSKFILLSLGNTLEVGTVEEGGLWPLLNPKLITLSTSTTGEVKPASEEPVLTPLTSNFENKFSLASSTKDESIGRIYLDDSLRKQEDILSELITKYSKDLMNANKFISPCYFNPYIKLGRIVNNYLNNPSNSGPSLYNQSYIISGFSHKIIDQKAFTHVEYTTTSFSSSTKIDTIAKNLFRPD